MSCPSCSTAACVGIPEGLAFGMILQKSRMSSPENIKSQMALKNWTMMKTFLSASGASTISLGLLDLCGAATLSPININLKGNLIGGAVMGVGMALGGACPGTVLAQVGEGISSAPYTLLGGLLGATVYGMVINNSTVEGLLKSTEVPGPFNTLHGLLGKPMWSIALPFGTALVGVACLLEKFFPTPKTDLITTENCIIKRRQWHPIYSGLALGSLQIPVNIFVKTTLGTSSAFVTAAGLLTRYLPINQEYFEKFTVSKSAKYLWQLVSDMSIMGGSYLSCYFAGSRAESKKLTNKEKCLALASGFLLLFGARTGNGCTSGQGLSQMANLSFGGMLGVFAMLASGLSVGIALNKLQK